jgi:hypothetical protein
VKPLAVGVEGVFDEIIVISNSVARRKCTAHVVPGLALLPEQINIQRIVGVSQERVCEFVQNVEVLGLIVRNRQFSPRFRPFESIAHNKRNIGVVGSKP